MPNEVPADFILRCIELREKLILTSKTSGEIEYDKVFVSCLSLRKVERGLESNLILQEITPVFRFQGVTDEDIISATQRATADEKDRTRNFPKRSSRVNRIVHKKAGSECGCSDPEKSKCDPESSKVISELTKALSAVTEQLAALRKDADVFKT